jgi:hypothetical protein
MWGDRYSYKILMWKCLGKCVFERLIRLGDEFVMDVRVAGCNDWRWYSRLRAVSDEMCQVDSVEGSYRMLVDMDMSYTRVLHPKVAHSVSHK